MPQIDYLEACSDIMECSIDCFDDCEYLTDNRSSAQINAQAVTFMKQPILFAKDVVKADFLAKADLIDLLDLAVAWLND